MFGYSRQVYYRSKHRQAKKRARAEEVVELIKQVRLRMPRLGCRKLYHVLQSDLRALGVGRDQLFKILRANHLLIKPKRSYHVTTQSHHRFRKHGDKAKSVNLNRPEQLWVSDITYIGNRKDPVYLALITDAYSKKIMGYNVSDNLKSVNCKNALQGAIKQRIYPKENLIHHSDRGFQYCSDMYQKVIRDNKIECSMTESYDPYANAIAERVNGILKQEFLGYDLKHPIPVIEELVRNSIEIYNKERPHWSCYMRTPNEMHQQSQIEIRSYKKITSAWPRPS